MRRTQSHPRLYINDVLPDRDKHSTTAVGEAIAGDSGGVMLSFETAPQFGMGRFPRLFKYIE